MFKEIETTGLGTEEEKFPRPSLLTRTLRRSRGRHFSRISQTFSNPVRFIRPLKSLSETTY